MNYYLNLTIHNYWTIHNELLFFLQITIDKKLMII